MNRDVVSVLEIFAKFLVIGSISFGGGAIGYLRQALVVDKGWLDDDEFLSGLELAQTLPGLNAINVGVYVGERLRGAAGAMAAALGLIFPGLVLVAALGAAYASLRDNASVLASLDGVAAAATGFLLAVALRVGRKQLLKWKPLLFVVATFVAMSILRLPLVGIVVVLGGFAVWLNRPGHDVFEPHDASETGTHIP